MPKSVVSYLENSQVRPCRDAEQVFAFDIRLLVISNMLPVNLSSDLHRVAKLLITPTKRLLSLHRNHARLNCGSNMMFSSTMSGISKNQCASVGAEEFTYCLVFLRLVFSGVKS